MCLDCGHGCIRLASRRSPSASLASPHYVLAFAAKSSWLGYSFPRRLAPDISVAPRRPGALPGLRLDWRLGIAGSLRKEKKEGSGVSPALFGVSPERLDVSPEH